VYTKEPASNFMLE